MQDAIFDTNAANAAIEQVSTSTTTLPPEVINTVTESQIDWNSLLAGVGSLVQAIWKLYSFSLLSLLLIIAIGWALKAFIIYPRLPPSTPYKEYVAYGLSFFIAWTFSPLYLPLIYGPVANILSNTVGVVLT